MCSLTNMAVAFPHRVSLGLARKNFVAPTKQRNSKLRPRPDLTKPVTMAMSINIEETAYLVGKGLTLWVMFTSGLNYLMYRKIRKDHEDN